MIKECKEAGWTKEIIIYANKGEEWDAVNNVFIPKQGSEESYEKLTKEWLQLGARAIGGCCQIGVETIAKIKNELKLFC